MKKIITLISMAALICGSAVAAPKGAKIQDVKKVRTEALQKHGELAKQNHVATRSFPSTDIIYNPKGKYEVYYKNESAYDAYGGGFYTSEDAAANVVFGDNNKIYIQDILGWGDDSYVEGTIDGDVINMPIPQTVSDYGWYSINLYVLEKVDEEEYEAVPEIDSVEFTYDSENRSFSLNLPGEDNQYMIGYVYTDDESWTGSGLFTADYRLFDGTINSLPEGVETEEYLINDGEFGHVVNVGFDGDMMYLEGMSVSLPLSVIYAKVDGNTANIAQNQILGSLWGYFIYTKVLNADFELAADNVEYSLIIDRENKVISSADPDNFLVLNGSLDELMYLELYQDFTLKVQTTFDGVPVDPNSLEYDDYYEDYGMSAFIFAVPNLATNGNVLLDENLAYRIYIDGELYEFDGDDYDGIDGVITEVPFNFDNGYDLYWYSPSMRVIMFYFIGAETFGVQSVYDYEGVVTESQIVTLNIVTGEVTGVDNLISNDIKSVTYYDLSGRKVNNPQNGIFIQRAVVADGSVKTKKVVVR